MRRLKPLAGAAACVLALAACHGGQPKSAASAAPAAGERYLVRLRDTPDLKPVAATITSRNQAEARARIGGVLTALYVKEGDIVRRGQLIGRVVDQRLGFETRAYEAQTAAAQAESARAQADYGRIKDLYDHGVYAKAKLDQSEASAKAAAAAVNAARAQRAASAEAAAQGLILAPADGRVLHAEVPAGSVVMPGQSVATVTAGQAVIRIEIPEADARALAPGQTVKLVSEDLGSGSVGAAVVQVYPDVTAGKVTADLAAPAGVRRDLVGQRVRAEVQIGTRAALIVPRRFIVTRYGMDYARVLARDGAASDVPVQTAPGPTPGDVEILSGLSSGDVLVRAGASR
jgi:RND family efflux transporter MFP subunit